MWYYELKDGLMGTAIITFLMMFLLSNNSFSPAVSEVQFCGSVKDGNYPIPQICTGYVSCLGGVTRHKLCPSGTLFNPLKKFCDLPVNVGCSQEKDLTLKRNHLAG